MKNEKNAKNVGNVKGRNTVHNVRSVRIEKVDSHGFADLRIYELEDSWMYECKDLRMLGLTG